MSAEPDDKRRGQARDRALWASIGSGVFVRLSSTALQLVAIAIAVRGLGDVRFGLLAALSALLGIMAFADFGIGSGLMTHLAMTVGTNDVRSARAMVSSAWLCMTALGLTVAVLGVLSAMVLPWSRMMGATNLPSHDVATSMAAFFLCAAVAIPASIGQRVLVGLQQGAVANLWLLAGAVTSLTGVAMCAWLELPLWSYVVATAGAAPAVATVASVWVLCWRHAYLRPSIRTVTRASAKRLAGVSGLFLVLNIAVAVAYQSDVVIVASTLGAGSAAVFAIGTRMFGVLTGTLAAASQQVWTSMAEAIARGDDAWVRTRFLIVVTGTWAVAAPVALAIVLGGPSIAEFWVGAAFVPSTSLLVALAVWAVYSITMTQVGYLLNAAHVVFPQVVMAVAMALVNVALSVYLTQRVGIVGPLLGSLVAHLTCSGVPSVILAVRVLGGRRRPAGACP